MQNLNEHPAMGLPEAARRLQENGVVVYQSVSYADSYVITTAEYSRDGYTRRQIIDMALALRGRETDQEDAR